ncbi:hypothetical protein MIR68_007392 [Amoeboaphelidium protococcarum]|nr:hypothetical protein MIR68_007392 [Amoeboaphelidium protococcarum]
MEFENESPQFCTPQKQRILVDDISTPMLASPQLTKFSGKQLKQCLRDLHQLVKSKDSNLALAADIGSQLLRENDDLKLEIERLNEALELKQNGDHGERQQQEAISSLEQEVQSLHQTTVELRDQVEQVKQEKNELKKLHHKAELGWKSEQSELLAQLEQANAAKRKLSDELKLIKGKKLDATTTQREKDIAEKEIAGMCATMAKYQKEIEEKSSIIMDLAGKLDVADAAKQATVKEMEHLKLKLFEAEQIEIELHQSNESLAECHQIIEQLQAQLETRYDNFGVDNEPEPQSKSLFSEVEDKRVELESKHNMLQEKHSNLMQQHKKQVSQQSKLKSQIGRLNQMVFSKDDDTNHAYAERAMRQLQQENLELQKENHRLQNAVKIEGDCRLNVGTIIPGGDQAEVLQTLKLRIDAQNAEIDRLKKEASQLKLQKANERQVVYDLQQQVQKKEQELSKSQLKLSNLKMKYDSLKAKLVSDRAQVSAASEPPPKSQSLDAQQSSKENARQVHFEN